LQTFIKKQRNEKTAGDFRQSLFLANPDEQNLNPGAIVISRKYVFLVSRIVFKEITEMMFFT